MKQFGKKVLVVGLLSGLAISQAFAERGAACKPKWASDKAQKGNVSENTGTENDQTKQPAAQEAIERTKAPAKKDPS